MPNPPQKPQLSVVERRRAPRYEVNFPCKVTTLEGKESIFGFVSDLSLSGLQLQGNTRFVRVLYPNFKREDWRTPLQAEVAFSLPTSEQQSARVNLSCQLIYCTRSRYDLYKIGCQFVHINPEAQQAMEDHIRHFGIVKE